MNQKNTQFTLRGLPSSVLKELKKEARQKRVSLNQVFVERLSPPPDKKREGDCAELLDLAGTWDKKRAEDFEQALKEIRKIDLALWSS